MTLDEQFQRIQSFIAQLGYTEAIKRLERGGGSGAMSCCEGREAGEHQDGAEESREDLPRCAGEARQLALQFMPGWWESRADSLEKAADRPTTLQMKWGWRKELKAQASELRWCAQRLREVLGEPDSEARDERSGQRNEES